MLLTWWQAKHKADALPIARWVSHFRMPSIQSDFRVHKVVIPRKSEPNLEGTYKTGTLQYGHNLCKPNCQEYDYITGELIHEPLPF